MNWYKIFDIGLKLLATAAVLGQRFAFGPVGAGGGLCDGIVIYAIWRFGAVK
jgi:hypothetical protein